MTEPEVEASDALLWFRSSLWWACWGLGDKSRDEGYNAKELQSRFFDFSLYACFFVRSFYNQFLLHTGLTSSTPGIFSLLIHFYKLFWFLPFCLLAPDLGCKKQEENQLWVSAHFMETSSCESWVRAWRFGSERGGSGQSREDWIRWGRDFVFNFQRKLYRVSRKWSHQLTFPPQCLNVPLSPHLSKPAALSASDEPFSQGWGGSGHSLHLLFVMGSDDN